MISEAKEELYEEPSIKAHIEISVSKVQDPEMRSVEPVPRVTEPTNTKNVVKLENVVPFHLETKKSHNNNRRRMLCGRGYIYVGTIIWKGIKCSSNLAA